MEQNMRQSEHSPADIVGGVAGAPGRAAYTVNAKANTGLIAIHALIERLWQQGSRERSVGARRQLPWHAGMTWEGAPI
jgi:hypothetical protein